MAEDVYLLAGNVPSDDQEDECALKALFSGHKSHFMGLS